MWMLAPAVATVVALTVLVAGLRTVARAAAELTTVLRRSSAAAVAGDELSRLAARLGDHAEATRARADRVRGARRDRSRRQPRSQEAERVGGMTRPIRREAVARAARERSEQERE